MAAFDIAIGAAGFVRARGFMRVYANLAEPNFLFEPAFGKIIFTDEV